MRRDAVSQLPPPVRAAIDKLLVENGFAGYKELERLILDEHGVKIGKSSLQRYGARLERRLGAIRASTEAARAIAEAAPDEADQRSAAVISLVQSDLFEALLSLQEAQDEDIDTGQRVELLSRAARAIAETGRASIGNKKWAAEIREQARKDAADAAEQVAKRGGLSAESVQELRRAILGVHS